LCATIGGKSPLRLAALVLFVYDRRIDDSLDMLLSIGAATVIATLGIVLFFFSFIFLILVW
jgi:hypothetical protein